MWAHRQLFPSGTSSNEVVLDVPTGSSTNSIVDLLEKKGVLDNAFLFKLYVRWKEGGRSRPGSYRFPRPAQADEGCTDPRSDRDAATKRFTLPPGLNLRQVPA